MLKRLLALVGLSSLLERIENGVVRFADAAADKAKAEARFYGVVAVLGTAAAATGFVTFVAAVGVIVVLVNRYWGDDAALAAALLIPAMATAALGSFAYLRIARRKPTKPLFREVFGPSNAPPAWRPDHSPEAPRPPFRSTAFPSASTQGELRTMLEGALGEFFRAPPATGTPLDRVVNRLTGEAAAASDRTVGLAADALATGSRKVVFGLLAATAALGWCLARKPMGSNSL